MGINKVMITGNTTRDAELRTTSGGTPVLTFGVAVNERRRTASGEWEDYANFIDCSLFGRRGEALEQYLAKGTKVAVEGRLHYSSWEDRNGGGRRSKLEVYVDEIEFLSSRQGAQEPRGGQHAAQARQRPQAGAQGRQSAQQCVQQAFPGASVYESPAPAAYDDDDIPF